MGIVNAQPSGATTAVTPQRAELLRALLGVVQQCVADDRDLAILIWDVAAGAAPQSRPSVLIEQLRQLAQKYEAARAALERDQAKREELNSRE